MKGKNSKFLASVCVSSALMVSTVYPSVNAMAAEVAIVKTKAVTVDVITVANNEKEAEDTIKVTGLVTGDIVKVYDAASKGKELGTTKVAENATDATITGKDLLAVAGGTVYVSVQSKDQLESPRTAKKYDTQVSLAPAVKNIVILNNDDADDIVRVTGLESGDVVKVYGEATGGEVIEKATVQGNKTAVNVKIPQLGIEAGKVYVTVTKPNKDESKRVGKDYIAE
ncbi:TPA: IMP dehydrogenase [Bacillus anthracis]|uniref:IMP dehydrogenase n=1 Tax=Bacillus anthracis TaxID=1392 RepID=UPI002841269A|nr:IMP dehydrogenase [Bacillus anthracis]MDR4355288.1 IMP dehydrogenase [Bacillus anthracis]MDR4373564.1 IMP dehydrogenase [Bacillus anthracis]HDR5287055.1 IMP dehydrogenase [Bacillus anthracis]HDR5742130.1 IMP dehydrogenase [Bacillus anthracis]HDR5747754.1 IMP dehydrogenase [Bacillus anthracis]